MTKEEGEKYIGKFYEFKDKSRIGIFKIIGLTGKYTQKERDYNFIVIIILEFDKSYKIGEEVETGLNDERIQQYWKEIIFNEDKDNKELI